MAQSLLPLPSEQVLVECRAFVFFYDIQLNRWTEVGEQNVYSRIQLISSRPPGSTGLYRIQARLESNGMISINTALTEQVTYVISTPSWHQVRIDIGMIYGLRLSPESDGNKFAVIIQHTLRSLQGTRNQPILPPPPDPLAKGAAPLAAAAPFGMPRSPEPPSQDGGRAQKRRETEVQIDALCAALSDAITNGRQDQAVEIVKKMAYQKLFLSIKLKNPTLVTMDSGSNTITIRVVVEDKESSGGTFSIKVAPTCTIERLQQEVFDRYGFPVQVQKWIMGKKIPKPGETLQDLNIKQSGTTVFLYLLSGKTVGLRRSDVELLGRGDAAPISSTVSAASISSNTGVITNTTAVTTTQVRHAASVPNLTTVASVPHVLAAPNRAEQLNPTPPQSVPNVAENSGPETLPPIRLGMSISTVRNLIAQQSGGQGEASGNPPNPSNREAFVHNSFEPVEQQAEEDEGPVGWTCGVCTYINAPTRPGCEMCSADRPADYVVPAGAQLDDRERSRLAAAEREEALFQQGEERPSMDIQNIQRILLESSD